ncbi:MAG: protein translocase SEC61 complex subunit gamma [Candidatus Thorarchaeota archaeon]|nr:protein translocase SEC61 complex subunit gamma [Candidatus Thorarchaeota archaeon]
MGISQFVNDSRRILKLATKPSKKEMWMNTKVSILAMFLVGMLSYLIQVLMTIITGNWVGT